MSKEYTWIELACEAGKLKGYKLYEIYQHNQYSEMHFLVFKNKSKYAVQTFSHMYHVVPSYATVTPAMIVDNWFGPDCIVDEKKKNETVEEMKLLQKAGR